MDKSYIERENVIERYVRGTLPETDMTAFELFMLEHPDIAEDVEYARGLDAGMRLAREEFFAADKPVRERTLPFWQTPQYATAATILLVSFTFATMYLSQRGSLLNSEIERLRAPAEVSHEVWLEALRGSSELLIERRAGEAVLLRTVLDDAGDGPFRIQLFDADGREVWSQSNATADDEPSVSIFARDLPDGRYRITVTAQGSAAVAADRTFRLIEAAN